MPRLLLACAGAALLMSGCATLPDHARYPGARGGPSDGPTCADRSADATLRSSLAASRLAEDALLVQLRDARGDMVTAGLRHLRVERKPTQCTPIDVLGHEVHCKASGSVCGR